MKAKVLSPEQHDALVELRLAQAEKAELDAGKYLSGDSPLARAREREVVECRLALAVRAVVRLGVGL